MNDTNNKDNNLTYKQNKAKTLMYKTNIPKINKNKYNDTTTKTLTLTYN